MGRGIPISGRGGGEGVVPFCIHEVDLARKTVARDNRCFTEILH